MNEVTIAIEGKKFQGWKDVTITKKLDAISQKFRSSFSDRWTPNSEPFQIVRGSHFDLKIDDDEIMHGHIDTIIPSISNNNHELIVEGFDDMGDLVDCSAINEPGEFKGLTLDRLILELVKPFGIGVSVKTDIGKAFTKFKIQVGETVFEAIDRACRQRAVIPLSNGKSTILLSRSATDKVVATLEYGVNIKAASGNYSNKGRFSRYIVDGQQNGDDEFEGPSVTAIRGEATDAGINRYRPLKIVTGNSVDIDTAKNMAEWEAAIRAARAEIVNITVQGWRRADGALWNVNELVKVKVPIINVNDTLLVTSVTMVKGRTGTETMLMLSRKDAFTPKPEVKKEDSILASL